MEDEATEGASTATTSLPAPILPAHPTDQELAETAEALTGANTHHFDEEETDAILKEGRRVLQSVEMEMNNTNPHLGHFDGYADQSVDLETYDDDNTDADSVAIHEFEESEAKREHRVQKRARMLAMKAKSIEDENTFLDSFITLAHYSVESLSDRELLIEAAHAIYNSTVVVEKGMQPNDPEELTEEIRNDPAKLVQLVKQKESELAHERNVRRFHNSLMVMAVKHVQTKHKERSYKEVLQATSDDIYQATHNRHPHERAAMADSRNASTQRLTYSADDDRIGEGLTAVPGNVDHYQRKDGSCEVM